MDKDIFKEFDVMLSSGNTELYIEEPDAFWGNSAGFGYEDDKALMLEEGKD